MNKWSAFLGYEWQLVSFRVVVHVLKKKRDLENLRLFVLLQVHRKDKTVCDTLLKTSKAPNGVFETREFQCRVVSPVFETAQHLCEWWLFPFTNRLEVLQVVHPRCFDVFVLVKNAWYMRHDVTRDE